MNAVSIIGVVTVFGLVFLWLLALCAEKGVRPFRRVRQGCRRLPGWKKALILIFVSVWIAFAGTKDGTNGVDQVEGDTNTVTQVEGGTNDWENIEGTNTIGQIDGEGTNGTGLVSGPLMMGFRGRPNLMQGLPTAITTDDVAQMWRVGATVDGNAFAVPTANAVTNLDWCDYGGLQMESVKWRM